MTEPTTDLPPNVLTVPPDRVRVTVTFEHGDGRNSIVEVVLNDEGGSIEEVLAVLRVLVPGAQDRRGFATMPYPLRPATPMHSTAWVAHSSD